ncbi:L-fuculokinase [Halalkalibacter kiskunsagensis]|uniref:L-fuculokinase n=1 Tax=Halalkalibacter kiskunsagensis TaxID=1548599 RepID=A0ABV6KFW9_9BACI
MKMRLLGIDIGTTHIKAGLFECDGTLVQIAIRSNQSHLTEEGLSYYNPDEMWRVVTQLIKEVTSDQHEKIVSIGITSMAESGLLLNPKTNECHSHIIPWFDRRTEEVSNVLQQEIDPVEQFQKTGLHNSYKSGLAKLLWLKQQDPQITTNAKWLSTSDFIAYKLTGKVSTDYSLAARTFAFRIDQKKWDIPLIRHFGLGESLFPEVNPSGTGVGEVSQGFEEIGLEKGISVAVSGHDHVCAALAVGVTQPGVVLDSMGTAETLVGSLHERGLTKKEYESGFTFGCHVVPNRLFWMGGIQSSGGSVEWLRSQLSSQHLSYEEMKNLLDQVPSSPTGMLYYPYLTGSGSPQPDPNAKGAFIGLKSTHKKGDLLKALLEGTAFELEYMRRAAEKMQDCQIQTLIAVGGGTKNQQWLQIKADVTNCHLLIPPVSEATLLGAAMAAGLGSGVYKDEAELLQLISQRQENNVYPNTENQQKYQTLFEEGYLFLQEPLRSFYKKGL